MSIGYICAADARRDETPKKIPFLLSQITWFLNHSMKKKVRCDDMKTLLSKSASPMKNAQHTYDLPYAM